jgi:hypothetical protein
MKVFNFFLHFIFVMLTLQSALAGDEIIEDVDEAEPPENIEEFSFHDFKPKEFKKKFWF